MATFKLNFKGLSCPLPIVKTSSEIRKGASGDIYEVTADDPGFEKDIAAWCNTTGNKLAGIAKTGKDITATITKK
ncbi:MAG: sulfurtransferase TusA family protein [Nitrospiraceae bacterium]|nr:sulfurtransferase TusA family protein [Nitrospiraceae bacterium]